MRLWPLRSTVKLLNRLGGGVKLNTRNTELFHYGVLGMKWGVRKARKKAQKEKIKGRDKSSTGKNYDEALSKSRSEMASFKRNMAEKTDAAVTKYNKAHRSGDINKILEAEENLSGLNAEYFAGRSRLMKKGQQAINEASLRDAGYSEKEAREGAEYLRRKGINLSFYGI